MSIVTNKLTNLFKAIETSSVNMTKGLFLLILAVSGNFVAETLSCQAQKNLSQNMLIKQIVIIMIIYFAINFTGNRQHPLNTVIKSLVIWLFFLLFTKMNIGPTCLVIFLLFSLYVLNNFINYYETETKTEEETNNKLLPILKKLQVLLFISIVITIIVGFVWYMAEKRIEYKQNFKFSKFLFGVLKCKSLQ